MSHTILLYGATGYSGRIIAAEAAASGMRDSEDVPGYRMVLGGRDGREVAKLAAELDMEARAFGIGNRREVVAALHDIDVVVNAAGPFALTANHLAKGALAAGCHYVDINGEAEVYMKLDDLGHHASQRGLKIVSAAGHTAAASDLLLHAALQELKQHPHDMDEPCELGAVRIGVSRIDSLSRGSLETLWRSLREQVRVVRDGKVVEPIGDGELVRAPVLWHEPVGKLERTFDFFDPARARISSGTSRASDLRIASAANLADTLTARLTLDRHGFRADRIESYVEAGAFARALYQFGPVLAPLAAMPFARDLVRAQLDALPAGPTKEERDTETHLTVLEIEDPFQDRIVHWAWHTPNPYDFTARVVVQIAKTVASGAAKGRDSASSGWLTPSDVVQPDRAALTARSGYLRGCQLFERRTALSGIAR